MYNITTAILMGNGYYSELNKNYKVIHYVDHNGPYRIFRQYDKYGNLIYEKEDGVLFFDFIRNNLTRELRYDDKCRCVYIKCNGLVISRLSTYLKYDDNDVITHFKNNIDGEWECINDKQRKLIQYVIDKNEI